MANTTEFVVDSAALNRALRNNPDIHRALLRVGVAIETEAKTLAPVDTGRLRASIATTPDVDSVLVGTDVEYAAFQEYGTVHQAGTAFLYPAAYAVLGRLNGTLP